LSEKYGITYQRFEGLPGERAALSKIQKFSTASISGYRPERRKSQRRSKTKNLPSKDLQRDTRSSLSSDAKTIAKNREYVQSLIDLLTAISRDARMTPKELIEQVQVTINKNGLKPFDPEAKLRRHSNLGRLERPNRVAGLKYLMSHPEFIAGAISWLSESFPEHLQNFYVSKNLSYETYIEERQKS